MSIGALLVLVIALTAGPTWAHPGNVAADALSLLPHQLCQVGRGRRRAALSQGPTTSRAPRWNVQPPPARSPQAVISELQTSPPAPDTVATTVRSITPGVHRSASAKSRIEITGQRASGTSMPTPVEMAGQRVRLGH